MRGGYWLLSMGRPEQSSQYQTWLLGYREGTGWVIARLICSAIRPQTIPTRLLTAWVYAARR